jgi:hypothetical protein
MKQLVGKVLLLFAALLCRSLFVGYKLLLNAVLPLTLLLGAGWLVYMAITGHAGARMVLEVIAAGAVLLAIVSVYLLYHYGDGILPKSAASNWANRLIDRFIAWIGTLKFFCSPYCMVEDPGSYRIRGSDMRKLLDDGAPLLQPGDILLRGYDGYVDGELIRRTGGGQGNGKYFSHAAMYVGKLDETDKNIVARRLQVPDGQGGWRAATQQEMDGIRNNPGFFHAGEEMVIHSMGKGVFVEDILTFLRCDYLAVIRLPDEISASQLISTYRPVLREALSGDALVIDEKLRAGQNVSRAEVVKAAKDSALGKIGSCYDFQFDSVKEFNRFSCSEFVYYCYKSVHRYIGLETQVHSFLGLFARNTITPPDVYNAAGTLQSGKKLEIVWEKTG